MFSDHLLPVSPSRTRQWLIVGAAVVMVCQLVALAWLAGGQVDKATTRVAGEVAKRERVAQCVEKSSGATRHLCNRQDGVETFAAQPVNTLNIPALSAREKSALGGLMPAANHRSGYVAASFTPAVLSKH